VTSEPTISGLVLLAAFVGVPVHEAPDEPEEAGAREREPGQVERLVGPVRLVEHARERERDEPDRDVEPEDPLPRDSLHDGTADQRTGRDREPGDPRPGPQREAALLGREGRGEDGQRERGHDRATDPLDGTSCDQRLHRRGERCGRGGGGEEAEADDEHAPAAEAVAERRPGEQEDRERERVGVHRPLELLDRRAEVGADHRQGGRDDEVVEDDHEERDRGDHERPQGLRAGLHRASAPSVGREFEFCSSKRPCGTLGGTGSRTSRFAQTKRAIPAATRSRSASVRRECSGRASARSKAASAPAKGP